MSFNSLLEHVQAAPSLGSKKFNNFIGNIVDLFDNDVGFTCSDTTRQCIRFIHLSIINLGDNKRKI